MSSHCLTGACCLGFREPAHAGPQDCEGPFESGVRFFTVHRLVHRDITEERPGESDTSFWAGCVLPDVKLKLIRQFTGAGEGW